MCLVRNPDTRNRADQRRDPWEEGALAYRARNVCHRILAGDSSSLPDSAPEASLRSLTLFPAGMPGALYAAQWSDPGNWKLALTTTQAFYSGSFVLPFTRTVETRAMRAVVQIHLGPRGVCSGVLHPSLEHGRCHTGILWTVMYATNRLISGSEYKARED